MWTDITKGWANCLSGWRWQYTRANKTWSDAKRSKRKIESWKPAVRRQKKNVRQTAISSCSTRSTNLTRSTKRILRSTGNGKRSKRENSRRTTAKKKALRMKTIGRIRSHLFFLCSTKRRRRRSSTTIILLSRSHPMLRTTLTTIGFSRKMRRRSSSMHSIPKKEQNENLDPL